MHGIYSKLGHFFKPSLLNTYGQLMASLSIPTLLAKKIADACLFSYQVGLFN